MPPWGNFRVALACRQGQGKTCGSVLPGWIIEVRAGDGAVLSELEGSGFSKETYALEVSGKAVEAIKKRGLAGLKDARLFDGYDMDYSDNYFDLAILTRVLEHVEHPLLLLKEVSRVARHVFMECPLEYNLQGVRDIPSSHKYGHINYYSQTLQNLLIRNAGLEIVSSRVLNPSLDIYKYHSRNSGILKCLVKGTLLKVSPFIATRLFIYVYCVLCKGKTG